MMDSVYHYASDKIYYIQHVEGNQNNGTKPIECSLFEAVWGMLSSSGNKSWKLIEFVPEEVYTLSAQSSDQLK